jgi:hypothetical protein
LAPPNLWYEGIVVENKPFRESIPYTDPRSGQVRERMVRVDRPVLRLKGYVISVDGERPTISPLTLATEEDPEFSRRFQLLTTSFADTTFETFPVRSFTLEYSIEFPRTAAEEAGLVEDAVAADDGAFDEFFEDEQEGMIVEEDDAALPDTVDGAELTEESAS